MALFGWPRCSALQPSIALHGRFGCRQHFEVAYQGAGIFRFASLIFGTRRNYQTSWSAALWPRQAARRVTGTRPKAESTTANKNIFPFYDGVWRSSHIVARIPKYSQLPDWNRLIFQSRPYLWGWVVDWMVYCSPMRHLSARSQHFAFTLCHRNCPPIDDATSSGVARGGGW